MNVVSIVSSARRNGNTGRIAGAIEKELLSLGQKHGETVSFEKVNLYDLNLGYCRGCRACFEKGEVFCPCKDTLLTVRDKILGADALLLSSPVYVEDVSGLLKTFIDRLAFLSYRPVCAGKTALCITSSGVGSSGHAIKTMARALGIWGFHICGRHNFRAGGMLQDEYMRSRYSKKIKKIAAGFFNAVRVKKALKPSILSLIVFTVQQASWRKTKEPKMAYSRAYWKDKGLLGKGVSFYIPHRAGPVKTAAARAIGKLIALFFV